MNRALPPGDRGHRSADPRGAYRRRRVVPGSVGLVVGVEDLRRRKTPPDVNPAARKSRAMRDSGFHGVAPLPVFALGGHDGQTYLLPNRAGQEPPNRVWLPAGGFHQLLARNAARPLEQFENRLGLTAFADPLLLARLPRAGGLGFWARFGRFLGGGGLLARLSLGRRDVRATCANVGLFRGFRVLGRGGWGGSDFSVLCHGVFSFSGAYRGHHMDHSEAFKMQVNSAQTVEG